MRAITALICVALTLPAAVRADSRRGHASSPYSPVALGQAEALTEPRAPGAQEAMALLRSVASEIAAGKVPQAPASSDLVREAFGQSVADLTAARLAGAKPLIPSCERVAATLARWLADPAAMRLFDAARTLVAGRDPYARGRSAFERALSAYCAIWRVPRSNRAAMAVERRKRTELALQQARERNLAALELRCLITLGNYWLDSGDAALAEPLLAAAVEVADLLGDDGMRVEARLVDGLARARLDDPRGAMGLTSEARAIAESSTDASVRALAVNAYRFGSVYAEALGDLAGAIDNAELLSAARAGNPTEQAESWESLARLLARDTAENPSRAPRAAHAFQEAARLREQGGNRAEAFADLISATVIRVEAGDAGAVAVAAQALRAAERLGDPLNQLGAIYWMGRAHLAMAVTGGDRSSQDEAVAYLEQAIDRVDELRVLKVPAADLQAFLLPTRLWLGRAYLAGPRVDGAKAAVQFERAIDIALEAGDVNSAVHFSEWTLRAVASGGDPAELRHVALRLHQRLVDSKRIEAQKAAQLLTEELARLASSTSSLTVPGGFVEAVTASTPGLDALALRATVVQGCLTSREVLQQQAPAVLRELRAADRTEEAALLATLICERWMVEGDADMAAAARAEHEAMQNEVFKKAVAGSRPDVAARAAGELAASARVRHDLAECSRWTAAAAEQRSLLVESLKAAGSLGQAGEECRRQAVAFEQCDQPAAAAVWYARAAEIAAATGDRAVQARALTGRARAELASGNLEAATVAADEARALVVTADGDITTPGVAAEALRVAGLASLRQAQRQTIPGRRQQLLSEARTNLGRAVSIREDDWERSVMAEAGSAFGAVVATPAGTDAAVAALAAGDLCGAARYVGRDEAVEYARRNGTATDPVIAQRIRDARAAIGQLRTEEALARERRAQGFSGTTRALQSARAEASTRLQALRAVAPLWAAALDVIDAKGSAADDPAIWYLPTDERLWILVGRAGQFELRQVEVSRAELEGLVVELRRTIALGVRSPTDRSWEGPAADLSKYLVTPVTDVLAAPMVDLVPTGVVARVPFALLMGPDRRTVLRYGSWLRQLGVPVEGGPVKQLGVGSPAEVCLQVGGRAGIGLLWPVDRPVEVELLAKLGEWDAHRVVELQRELRTAGIHPYRWAGLMAVTP